MKNIFEHTSASWVKYSDYEWRTTEDGKEYLLPTKDAMPKPYDPMKDADNLVLAAADIGLMLFHKNPEKAIKAAMQAFACKYGLMGIMTALPTTARFIEYEKVYFHKNQIIKELDAMGYSRQQNQKMCQIGDQHPDRDAQFLRLARSVLQMDGFSPFPNRTRFAGLRFGGTFFQRLRFRWDQAKNGFADERFFFSALL